MSNDKQRHNALTAAVCELLAVADGGVKERLFDTLLEAASETTIRKVLGILVNSEPSTIEKPQVVNVERRRATTPTKKTPPRPRGVPLPADLVRTIKGFGTIAEAAALVGMGRPQLSTYLRGQPADPKTIGRIRAAFEKQLTRSATDASDPYAEIADDATVASNFETGATDAR